MSVLVKGRKYLCALVLLTLASAIIVFFRTSGVRSTTAPTPVTSKSSSISTASLRSLHRSDNWTARTMEYYDSANGASAPLAVVSIITVVSLGEAAQLSETISSVKNQSLQNWEWVLVDLAEGSEKDSRELKSFVTGLKDNRIRLMRCESAHDRAQPLNFAVLRSRGRYIYPLHHTDLLSPTALEILFFALASIPDASFIDGHHGVGLGLTDMKDTESTLLAMSRASSGFLVRRDHWQAVGGYSDDKKPHEVNWDFLLRLRSDSKWGFSVPELVTRRLSHMPRNDASQEDMTQFAATLRLRFPSMQASLCPLPPPRELLCPGYSFYQPMDTGVVVASAAPVEGSTSTPASFPLSPLKKRKPRLMLIVPYLVVGGADKFNRDFVRGMVAADWEVTVVGTLKTEHAWRGSFEQYTPDIFLLANFLPYGHYPRFLRHLMLARHPDVVMTSNSGLAYNLIPFLTDSCPQAVFVDYAHAEHMSFFHGGWARVAKGSSPWYDVMFVASSHLGKWMVSAGNGQTDESSDGVERDKVVVLHVGVYADEYRRNGTAREVLRTQIGVTTDTVVVTLAARLDSMKQPLILCEVAHRLLSSKGGGASAALPPLHFLVAGDGDQRSNLEACITKHQLQTKFTLLGAQSIEQMKPVMSASDVLFLSSQMEGIPCVFYEAMAAQVPVVGPDVGGIAEILLDNVTGYLVNVKDGTEFDYKLVSVEEQTRRYTDAMWRLLQNPTRARQMGNAGEKRIHTEFSMMGTVQKFIDTVTSKKVQKQKQKQRQRQNIADRKNAAMCHASPSAAKKLNEKAATALIVATTHMGPNPTSAYC